MRASFRRVIARCKAIRQSTSARNCGSALSGISSLLEKQCLLSLKVNGRICKSSGLLMAVRAMGLYLSTYLIGQFLLNSSRCRHLHDSYILPTVDWSSRGFRPLTGREAFSCVSEEQPTKGTVCLKDPLWVLSKQAVYYLTICCCSHVRRP